MLPNALFQATTDPRKSSYPNHRHDFSYPRKSHYFTRDVCVSNADFLEPPGQSSRQTPRHKSRDVRSIDQLEHNDIIVKRKQRHRKTEKSNFNSDEDEPFSSKSDVVKNRKYSGDNSSGIINIASKRRIQDWNSSRLCRSYAVEKPSFNPLRDFRDSMMEMVLEMNITEKKDLENLLSCYLFLNADEHHALIINAFKQIWELLFDLTSM